MKRSLEIGDRVRLRARLRRILDSPDRTGEVVAILPQLPRGMGPDPNALALRVLWQSAERSWFSLWDESELVRVR